MNRKESSSSSSVPTEHPWMTAFRRFFSGALSGTATAALLQPLDVIKTTQQSRHLQNMVTFPSSFSSTVSSSSSKLSSVSTTTTTGSSSPPATVTATTPPKPVGIIRTTMHLIQEQGYKSLWKGLGATIIRVFFGAGIYFVILQTVSDVLAVNTSSGNKIITPTAKTVSTTSNAAASSSSSTSPSLPWLSLGVRSFIAGVTARSIAAAVLSPIAVVKTRMEYMDIRYNHPYRNTFRAVRNILQTEGWASLYSGLIPTIARDAPFSGIYYTSYNYFKTMLQFSTDTNCTSSSSSSTNNPFQRIPLLLDPYPVLLNFLAGLGGGIIATFLTHPADVLKTRLQLKNAHGQFVDGRHMYHEALQIYRHEHIKGYFIGLNTRIVKRGFSTAITWTLFEEAMRRSGSGSS